MRAASLFRSIRPRSTREVWGMMLVLMLAAGCAGIYLLWQHVRPTTLASDAYRLDPRDIQIMPPPEWIGLEDLRMQALRDASLDGPQSLLDPKLAERIGLAFAAHPWVERVERVEKFHPARVEVRLVYRRPVAGVVVGPRLLPIDRFGVLLPSENFPPAELEKFPRITGIMTRPAEHSGLPWADGAVRGAAIIAAAFGDEWRTMGLGEIYASSRETIRGIQTHYVLITLRGTEIPWGPQPLPEEPASGLSAEEKIARLRDFIKQHGALDGVAQAGLLEAGRWR